MSNKTKSYILIFIIVVIILISTMFSPNLTIRRDLFFRLQPMNALLVDINKTEILNHNNSVYYRVNKGEDFQTSNNLEGYYLKKKWIFWIIDDVGAP